MLNKKEMRIIQLCEERIEGMNFRAVEVEKNNEKILRGIRVGKNGTPLGIAVYWDDISRVCGKDYSEEAAVEYIAQMAKEHLDVRICYEDMLQWKKAKILVHKKLVNYERNRSRLKNMVHRRYLDLAEVYYLGLMIPGAGVGATEVSRSRLKDWGISESELKRQADENMPDEGYYLCTIQKMLKGCRIPLPEGELCLYVVTNRSMFFGAEILTSPELLKEVLGDLDGDYFILPSSTHEIILCPDDGKADAGALRKMVYTVNRTVVQESDFLSDSVYYYHADRGMIGICEERTEK